MHRLLPTVLLVMLGAGSAHAQARSGDVAAAEALFDEGRRMSAAGRFAEACARFEASMAVLPRLGVQLNLADCYEHLGKTASAWVAFGEAAALARRIADNREAFARQRKAALVPRLCRVRISVADDPVDGLVVMRDGVPVQASAFGADVPVDPGMHTVEATAPGRIPWSLRVAVPETQPVTLVSIPDLARDPAAAAAAPETSGRRHPTPAAWIALGAGAVGIAAGSGLALAARSLWQEARPGCTSDQVCTDAAYALVQRSRRDGDLATAAFAIGGAALVAGVVLYLRAPHDRELRVRVVPALAPGASGVTITGAF